MQDGVTALHIAGAHGHTAVVELLLAKGANLNATDRVRSRVYITSDIMHDTVTCIMMTTTFGC